MSTPDLIAGPALLGLVVRALELGRAPGAGALTGETARRYFAGEPIKDTTRLELMRAVAQALTERRYLVLPDIAAGEGVASPDALAAAIHRLIMRWEAFRGFVRGTSMPSTHPELLAAFLRQTVIDLSLRWAALINIGGSRPPPPGVPAWAREDGWAEPLQRLKDLIGEGTRWKQVQDALGLEGRKSLENWLYARTRPGEVTLGDLAAAFEETVPGTSAAEHEVALRRHWGLAALATSIADRLGWEMVSDLGETLQRYTAEVCRRLTESKQPREKLVHVLWLIALEGFENGSAIELVKLLRNHERHRGWQADLEGVIEGPLRRLHWVAKTVAHERDIPEMAARTGLESEALREVLPAVARLGPGADVELAAGLPPALQAAAFGTPEALASLAASTAEAQQTRGDLLGAIETWRGAVNLDPGNADHHFRLGAALRLLGDLPAAAVELEIAAQLEPDNALAPTELAMLDMDRDDPNAALRRLEPLAARHAGNLHVLYHLGVAQLRAGRFAEALATLDRVLSVEPAHIWALDAATHAAEGAGNGKRARKLRKRAAALGHTVAPAPSLS